MIPNQLHQRQAYIRDIRQPRRLSSYPQCRSTSPLRNPALHTMALMCIPRFSPGYKRILRISWPQQSHGLPLTGNVLPDPFPVNDILSPYPGLQYCHYQWLHDTLGSLSYPPDELGWYSGYLRDSAWHNCDDISRQRLTILRPGIWGSLVLFCSALVHTAVTVVIKKYSLLDVAEKKLECVWSLALDTHWAIDP